MSLSKTLGQHYTIISLYIKTARRRLKELRLAQRNNWHSSTGNWRFSPFLTVLHISCVIAAPIRNSQKSQHDCDETCVGPSGMASQQCQQSLILTVLCWVVCNVCGHVKVLCFLRCSWKRHYHHWQTEMTKQAKEVILFRYRF